MAATDKAIPLVEDAIRPALLAAEPAELAGEVAEATLCDGRAGEADGPLRLYRGGSDTMDNLAPRPGIDDDGLSPFNTLERAARPGEKAQVIAPGRFERLFPTKTGSAGQYSLTSGDPTLDAEWAASRGSGIEHWLTMELRRAILDSVRRPG